MSIFDDDKITILNAQKVQHKIRPHGIDAPETRSDKVHRVLAQRKVEFGRGSNEEGTGARSCGEAVFGRLSGAAKSTRRVYRGHHYLVTIKDAFCDRCLWRDIVVELSHKLIVCRLTVRRLIGQSRNVKREGSSRTTDLDVESEASERALGGC